MLLVKAVILSEKKEDFVIKNVFAYLGKKFCHDFRKYFQQYFSVARIKRGKHIHKF